MFEPIKNQKIYQQVVEQIQSMLLEGSLKKGDRLPSERDMSERFQVSRASIREALRALEIIGIIESRQGEGNFIRESFNGQVFEPLSVMFKLNKGTFHDILEYRMIFEPQAAAMAASRIDDQEKEELGNLLDQLLRSDDDKESSALDLKIHRKIVAISGNYLMESTMTAISVIMQSFVEEARTSLFQWSENRAQLIDIHKRMCHAIMEGDSDRASKAVQDHFKLVLDNT